MREIAILFEVPSCSTFQKVQPQMFQPQMFRSWHHPSNIVPLCSRRPLKDIAKRCLNVRMNSAEFHILRTNKELYASNLETYYSFLFCIIELSTRIRQDQANTGSIQYPPYRRVNADSRQDQFHLSSSREAYQIYIVLKNASACMDDPLYQET